MSDTTTYYLSIYSADGESAEYQYPTLDAAREHMASFDAEDRADLLSMAIEQYNHETRASLLLDIWDNEEPAR